MFWYLLAALLLPSLIIYAYLHTGRPRRPGYTGNGDIYGALPDAAARAAEDVEPGHVDSIRSNLDLMMNAQLQGLRAAGREARRRESDGF